MRPTLLILAAGMGSRYGGLKQIDGIGPNKEPIIEYSIYDAIKSGFGKVVFVIRKEFDKAFRSRFDRFAEKISLIPLFTSVDAKYISFRASAHMGVLLFLEIYRVNRFCTKFLQENFPNNI